MMVLPFVLLLFGMLAIAVGWRLTALASWVLALGWQLWLFRLHATDTLPLAF